MREQLLYYQKYIFWFAVGIAFLFSILFFDLKISIGGDDSGYILGAKNFLEGINFPTWHGSFYPIFLTPFLWVFGINLLIFKILSILLIIGHLVFFYKTFSDNKIPTTVFYFCLIITAVSSHIAVSASTTYSEPLFMFLQAVTIYYFLLLDRKTEINKEYFSALWKNWLLLGLFMFLLSTTRNVGLGIVISVVLYLLLRKKFLPAFLSVIFWGFFYFLFNIYKKVVWNIEGVGFSNQLQNISYKHFYDHSQGTENFIGFVNRFIDNSNLYLSKHLSMMLGVRPLSSTIVSPALTIFFIILFVVSFYFVFKKYKQLLFIGIYIAVMLGVTFVTQQKHWDQERLILIYLPLICVFIGVGFYELFHLKLFKKIRLVPFIVFSLLCLSVFYQSIRRIDITSLQKNIKGDIYYGYTEDWVNYLKISEWAGNNLSDDAVILCRKASMSEIYGQREFFGIFRSPSTNPDSVYYFFEKNGITHVIMGSLRKFSKTKTQYTITTIRKTLMSYILKYPLSFNLVHKIGESEPGYLFEVVKKKNLNDEELIRIINSSIIINPNASYYYILGGRKMLEKKKFNDAKAYYNRMIQLDTEKKFFQAYFGRGVAYLELHEYSKAINDFLEVVKIKPENAEAWYNLGLCYNKLENIKTANEVFLKARELGYSSN